MSKDQDKQDGKTTVKKATDDPANTPGEDTETPPGDAAEANAGGGTTSKNAGTILNDLSRRNTASKAKARRRGGGMSGLMVFLLMLPFLAGAVFLAWQQYLLQATVFDLRRDNEELATRLADQLQTISTLRQQINARDTIDAGALQETEASFEAQLASLSRQLERLESQQRVSDVEPDYAWKIQEAAFLVRQAGLQLHLQGDVDSAINLLEMADVALAESGQSGVFNARQALSDDLSRLRSLEPVDREGVYLRLSNLAERLGDVDLLQSMRDSFDNRRSEESVPVPIGQSGSGWVGSGLAFLREVFVWRRWEEQPPAMLTEGQESVIKQTLRLLARQAQVALLERDGELYRRSLDEIEALLGRYAVTDSSQGQTVLGELDALRRLQIAAPLPALEQSSRALQQLLASGQ